MSEVTVTELIVLGVILLFAVGYLWRYIKRALGLGGQASACSGCSEGKSCPTSQSVSLDKKP